MDKSKLVKISVIEAILLVMSFAANIYGLMSDNPLQFGCNIVAIFFAVVYCAGGYKKEGQFYFKLYALFLSFKEAFALLHMALYEDVPAVSLVIVLLCYTCTVLLTFCLDLGKKTSYSIALMLNVLSLAAVIFVMVFTNYLSVLINNLTRLLLASVMYLMVWAKYQDKTSRNTK